MLAVTTRSGRPLLLRCSTPSGAAKAQTAVMSVAPRSASNRMVCSIEPPVASMGSRTSTARPSRLSGSDSR